jgi:hypothetical protein
MRGSGGAGGGLWGKAIMTDDAYMHILLKYAH